MFCKNCGKELKDNYKFCPKCGGELNESRLGANKSALETQKPKERDNIFNVLKILNDQKIGELNQSRLGVNKSDLETKKRKELRDNIFNVLEILNDQKIRVFKNELQAQIANGEYKMFLLLNFTVDKVGVVG